MFSCDIARPVSPLTCAAGRPQPAGGFLPPVATKLTQSPWFLKTPKVFQPPFLHWSLEVGRRRLLEIATRSTDAWKKLWLSTSANRIRTVVPAKLLKSALIEVGAKLKGSPGSVWN